MKSRLRYYRKSLSENPTPEEIKRTELKPPSLKKTQLRPADEPATPLPPPTDDKIAQAIAETERKREEFLAKNPKIAKNRDKETKDVPSEYRMRQIQRKWERENNPPPEKPNIEKLTPEKEEKNRTEQILEAIERSPEYSEVMKPILDQGFVPETDEDRKIALDLREELEIYPHLKEEIANAEKESSSSSKRITPYDNLRKVLKKHQNKKDNQKAVLIIGYDNFDRKKGVKPEIDLTEIPKQKLPKLLQDKPAIYMESPDYPGTIFVFREGTYQPNAETKEHLDIKNTKTGEVDKERLAVFVNEGQTPEGLRTRKLFIHSPTEGIGETGEGKNARILEDAYRQGYEGKDYVSGSTSTTGMYKRDAERERLFRLGKRDREDFRPYGSSAPRFAEPYQSGRKFNAQTGEEYYEVETKTPREEWFANYGSYDYQRGGDQSRRYPTSHTFAGVESGLEHLFRDNTPYKELNSGMSQTKDYVTMLLKDVVYDKWLEESKNPSDKSSGKRLSDVINNTFQEFFDEDYGDFIDGLDRVANYATQQGVDPAWVDSFQKTYEDQKRIRDTLRPLPLNDVPEPVSRAAVALWAAKKEGRKIDNYDLKKEVEYPRDPNNEVLIISESDSNRQIGNWLKPQIPEDENNWKYGEYGIMWTKEPYAKSVYYDEVATHIAREIVRRTNVVQQLLEEEPLEKNDLVDNLYVRNVPKESAEKFLFDMAKSGLLTARSNKGDKDNPILSWTTEKDIEKQKEKLRKTLGYQNYRNQLGEEGAERAISEQVTEPKGKYEYGINIKPPKVNKSPFGQNKNLRNYRTKSLTPEEPKKQTPKNAPNPKPTPSQPPQQRIPTPPKVQPSKLRDRELKAPIPKEVSSHRPLESDTSPEPITQPKTGVPDVKYRDERGHVLGGPDQQQHPGYIDNDESVPNRTRRIPPAESFKNGNPSETGQFVLDKLYEIAYLLPQEEGSQLYDIRRGNWNQESVNAIAETPWALNSNGYGDFSKDFEKDINQFKLVYERYASDPSDNNLVDVNFYLGRVRQKLDQRPYNDAIQRAMEFIQVLQETIDLQHDQTKSLGFYPRKNLPPKPGSKSTPPPIPDPAPITDKKPVVPKTNSADPIPDQPKPAKPTPPKVGKSPFAKQPEPDNDSYDYLLGDSDLEIIDAEVIEDDVYPVLPASISGNTLPNDNIEYAEVVEDAPSSPKTPSNIQLTRESEIDPEGDPGTQLLLVDGTEIGRIKTGGNDKRVASHMFPGIIDEEQDDVKRVFGLEIPDRNNRGYGYGKAIYLLAMASSDNPLHSWLYNSQTEPGATNAYLSLERDGLVEVHWHPTKPSYGKPGGVHLARLTPKGLQVARNNLQQLVKPTRKHEPAKDAFEDL